MQCRRIERRQLHQGLFRRPGKYRANELALQGQPPAGRRRRRRARPAHPHPLSRTRPAVDHRRVDDLDRRDSFPIGFRRSADHCVSADREGPHARDFRRHRAEPEAAVGQPAEPRHMLADRDVRAEQPRMHRPCSDMHVVDVVAVDADQRGAMFDQPIAPPRRSGRDGRQNRRPCASAGPSRCGPAPLAPDIDALELARRRSPGPARTACGRRSRAGRPAIRAAGRRGPCHRHIGGTGCRDRCRCWRPCRSGRSGRSIRRHSWPPTLTRPKIADVRPGQALVGRHAVLDHMAEVDDPGHWASRRCHRRFVTIRIDANSSDHHPHHVERGRRQRAVPPAVDRRIPPPRRRSSPGRSIDWPVSLPADSSK